MQTSPAPVSADQELAQLETRLPALIETLVAQFLAGATAVTVANLCTMFGGNARKAWAFDLSYTQNGAAQVLSCVMLSQFGGRQIDSDVAHEYHALSALNGAGLSIPQAICMDPTGAIIGHPSIVLQHLPGEANAVKLLRGVAADVGRDIIQDLAGLVAGLHAVPMDPAVFSKADAQLSPRDLVQNQINHWRAQFDASRAEPMPAMAGLFNWLDHNLPDPARISLVHGDLRPGNFLYQDSHVSGLLDWEMAHLGDPLEDIAWIYRPLWGPEDLLPLSAFMQSYQQISGPVAPHHLTYWRIFSEVKFATISTTASAAFAKGETSNIRHADRAAKIAPCLWRGLEMTAQFEQERANA